MKKWMGKIPDSCELCKEPFGEYFIDGATVMGCWALMCERCHRKTGIGLGIGKGQKYNTKSKKGVEGFK